MSEEKEVLNYDEDDSVKFIQEHLPKDMQGKFSDDEINYIVDLIYEYYDEKGFLDEDNDDDVEIDEEKLLDFVITNAQKDAKKGAVRDFSEEEIENIVAGELAYCDTLNLFY